ncbi:hypothetical protein Tco_0012872 [Tanacetum coccineum]
MSSRSFFLTYPQSHSQLPLSLPIFLKLLLPNVSTTSSTNKEVVTSIAVKITAKLHMALSIMKFGKDLPHLSKQGKLHEYNGKCGETAQHEPCGTSEEPEEVLEGRGQGELKPSKVLEVYNLFAFHLFFAMELLVGSCYRSIPGYVITISNAPSATSVTCYFASATAISKSVFKCSGIIHPVLGHATGEDPSSAHNRYPEIWALRNSRRVKKFTCWER